MSHLSTLPHYTAFFIQKRREQVKTENSSVDAEEMQHQEETTNCLSQRQTYGPDSMMSQEVLARQ